MERHRYRTLPIIPLDRFLAAHPEHVDSSEHELTIARIEEELQARQALERQRQELVKRKEGLVKETNAKKEELGKFDTEVEKWVVNGQLGARKLLEGHERKVREGKAEKGKEGQVSGEEGKKGEGEGSGTPAV
jgi:THO complex subunit 5